jgi:hypothetical protein
MVTHSNEGKGNKYILKQQVLKITKKNMYPKIPFVAKRAQFIMAI